MAENSTIEWTDHTFNPSAESLELRVTRVRRLRLRKGAYLKTKILGPCHWHLSQHGQSALPGWV